MGGCKLANGRRDAEILIYLYRRKFLLPFNNVSMMKIRCPMLVIAAAINDNPHDIGKWRAQTGMV